MNADLLDVLESVVSIIGIGYVDFVVCGPLLEDKLGALERSEGCDLVSNCNCDHVFAFQSKS